MCSLQIKWQTCVSCSTHVVSWKLNIYPSAMIVTIKVGTIFFIYLLLEICCKSIRFHQQLMQIHVWEQFTFYLFLPGF